MQNLLPLTARFRHVTVPGAARFRRSNLSLIDKPSDVTRVEQPATSQYDEELVFCRWLFTQAGLKPEAYRPETLKRRVPSCLRALRARRVSDARRMLERTPVLVHLAMSAMLVGVTSFFRDNGVFDALSHEISALARQQGALQVWSAGCSDGQELFSIAILLAELAALENSYLLGTDCRQSAVTQARLCLYSSEDTRAVPQHLIGKYFTRSGELFRLNQEIALSARFRVSDVLAVQEPGLWDVILCRNTAMYMEPEAQAMLWECFEDSLRPGGLLVLGKAERPSTSKRLVAVSPCIYRRAPLRGRA